MGRGRVCVGGLVLPDNSGYLAFHFGGNFNIGCNANTTIVIRHDRSMFNHHYNV